ncbi:MAG TPA: ATP-dependent zinc metalloprotease FtsH, partial [Rhodanobacteraceae bacterium]|nr:ATP-dependent zinc metalloprotease FtsH [Rhodanobacteraceae bacterium]
MNDLTKNILLWLVVLVIVVLAWQSLSPRLGGNEQQMSYSEFVQQVKNDNVASITISANMPPVITGKLKDGGSLHTVLPAVGDDSLLPLLESHRVKTTQKPGDNGFSLMRLIIDWLPFIVVFGLLFYIFRQMQSGAGGRGAMSFGRSRAKLQGEDQIKVTFADVAGCEEAKDEVSELVDFLRDPSKFTKLGGKIPRGVLMVGSPGTGKTLLAKAIAGEAKVPFFSISGSDFVEMFVGVGAARVRDMFEQAKKNAPCIVFIDEIDAVGRHRGAGLGGGNDEREQTLNQLLVEMDGFEANEGVILIAATNRPDVLDPALLRPGRFDRQVVVPNPDVGGREKILRVHMKKVPVAPDVDAKIIARGTPGFSGADLANLVNEAALLAARRGKRLVTMMEFESAKDKVLMGAERRSMVMTEDEKRLTAYHEAGHALVAWFSPFHDPLHKVTIIPRGRALGVTMSLPERDRYGYARKELQSKLAMMFGGRVAEEIIFGPDDVTTGASDDIRQATNLSRRMVTEWGMSEKLGPLRFSENEEEIFLGHSVTQRKNVSESTARLIDEEVKRIIEEAEGKARAILIE